MQKKIIEIKSNIFLVELLKSEGFKSFAIQQMLKNKDVKVNSKREKVDKLLCAGDIVEYFYDDKKNLKKTSLEKTIERVYEDGNLAIVVKLAGMNSCGANNSLEEFLNLIAVHRLDTNTSGLIIFAKNEDIKARFVEIFKKNLIEKKYICEVAGDSNFDGEIYSAYLFKDAKLGKSFVSPTFKKGYQEIKTRFKTIKHGQVSSLVECELLTGKMHQIRAQLSYLGHPIVGDKKYGNAKTNAFFKEKTQKLHCYCIKFKQIDDEKLNYLSNKTFISYPSWWGGKNE